MIEVEQNEEKIEEDGRREKKLYVEALKKDLHAVFEEARKELEKQRMEGEEEIKTKMVKEVITEVKKKQSEEVKRSKLWCLEQSKLMERVIWNMLKT